MSSAESLLLNTILNQALEKHASDVHLTVGNYPVIRVSGSLEVLTGAQIINPDFITTVVEAMVPAADQERLQRDREIVVSYTWADRARFRAQIFYQKGYPAVSLRLIPTQIANPKDLGISSIIINLIDQLKGLIIIAGPYHSGRTTTVCSLLENVNQRLGKHILTLERPIEYLLINNKAVISQREVGKDVPSFVQGAREALGDDMEIVMMSEMSEVGQAEVALELVEGGKLVVVVMNAQSVVTALESFLSDISPERSGWARQIIADNLLAVTAQRLIPKIAGGLALAYEILTMSAAVKSVMKDGNFYQLNNVMLTSRQDGMIALDRHLADLVKQGVIAADQAARYALDAKTLQQSMR
jgi:twitching motility protein PilT